MKPSKLQGCYEICDEWSREEQGEQGFINFFDCVGDLEHVSDLHRRDTTKAYSPHNIIKGDPHTRSHHTVYYNTLTAQGMRRAVERGIPKWVYYRRLKDGWSVKRASTVHYTRQRKAA